MTVYRLKTVDSPFYVYENWYYWLPFTVFILGGFRTSHRWMNGRPMRRQNTISTRADNIYYLRYLYDYL